ncbi:SDR family NAD(P)-dependent oxidoreductase [Paeniglutamicibacter sp.]|uniref:SDR family NAD(P)-dependent oxidoreductase n=1 Tax=Paeniglutamicibacter sp. TaxID=1934391 RepID=UPI0039894FD6
MTGKSRIAAITGGASGIGLAFARRWIESGGKAVLLDMHSAALRSAVEALGPTARGFEIDVTDRSSVDGAFRSIQTNEGSLDVLVNCAGIADPGPSHEVSDESFSRMLDIHVTGSMRCARAAYPLLINSDAASIVNLGSVATYTGMPQRASYTAAKAGIGGLTRTLAAEWAQVGIRVNAVGPGYVRTALTDSLVAEGKLRDEPIKARTPLGRFAEPDEIADAIHFLAGCTSTYITGHMLMADGGMSIDGSWY